MCLLLIVVLLSLNCLLIIRMKRSRDKTGYHVEDVNPTTNTADIVCVSHYEAYELHKYDIYFLRNG